MSPFLSEIKNKFFCWTFRWNPGEKFLNWGWQQTFTSQKIWIWSFPRNLHWETGKLKTVWLNSKFSEELHRSIRIRHASLPLTPKLIERESIENSEFDWQPKEKVNCTNGLFATANPPPRAIATKREIHGLTVSSLRTHWEFVLGEVRTGNGISPLRETARHIHHWLIRVFVLSKRWQPWSTHRDINKLLAGWAIALQ